MKLKGKNDEKSILKEIILHLSEGILKEAIEQNEESVCKLLLIDNLLNSPTTTEDNFHLVLLKMYTEQCFLY